MAPSTSGDGVDAALSYELAEQAVRLALGARALVVLDQDDDGKGIATGTAIWKTIPGCLVRADPSW